MTPNKQTVTTYMEGFRGTDRAAILSCLTDDVEWEIPGGFHARREEGVREVFCDVFETRDTKIRRLISYLQTP